MTGRNKTFLVIQVSLIAHEQTNIFDNDYSDTPQGRNKLFRDVFSSIANQIRIPQKGKMTDNFLLFSRRLSNDVLYFKLAKRRKTEINALLDNDIKPMAIDDFPNIDVFVNLRLQQLLIEIKGNIFTTQEAMETIRKSIEKHTQKYHFSVFANTVDDTKKFWDRVDRKNADEILEIEFEMIAPNFFGNSGQAKDLVSEAKDTINATEISMKFTNKEGKLRATMEHLDSYVKYTSFAGGWKVKIRKDGITKTLKSKDSSLKKVMPTCILDTFKELSAFKENVDLTDIYQKHFAIIENMFENRE